MPGPAFFFVSSKAVLKFSIALFASEKDVSLSNTAAVNCPIVNIRLDIPVAKSSRISSTNLIDLATAPKASTVNKRPPRINLPKTSEFLSIALPRTPNVLDKALKAAITAGLGVIAAPIVSKKSPKELSNCCAAPANV